MCIACAFKVLPVIAHLFFTCECAIWRVADYRVKPARLHDLREFLLPVEDVDAVAFLVVEQAALPPVVEVRADERVAALDVVGEVGQGTLVVQEQLVLERLLRFAFEHF